MKTLLPLTLAALGLCAGACQLIAPPPTSCTDGRPNGRETDLDCGGPDCPACATGGLCLTGADCDGRVCTARRCAAPTCQDGAQNGGEVGLDCGGPCPPCAAGCQGPSDCDGGACVDGGCVGPGPSCPNGLRDGLETDVDCGGGACPPCGVTQGCSLPGDCVTGLCLGGTCAPPCLPPLAPCGGACVDPALDPLHCGGCNQACDGGQTCGGGLCVPACGMNQLVCGGACVDPLTDSMHCGGCNRPCAPFDSCDAGRCCGPPPPGTYLQTCTNCEACEGLLQCLCDDAMQVPRAASLPFFLCNTDIVNCNGVLRCDAC